MAEPAKPADGVTRLLKWVGAATAVLSLIFGLRTLTNLVVDRRARDQQVTELTGTAQLQRESFDYSSAWASLDRAAEIDGDDQRVRTLQEDVAMDWLRNIRAEGTPPAFTPIVDRVTPSLTRGVLSATGQRRADLRSWLGWADFLRWRDGQRQVDPSRRYREAIGEDSLNVFANTMLAHWLLWTRGNPDEAKRHFAAALASGREREFVRDMQLAAYSNRSGAEDDAGLLALANEIRVSGEPVPELLRHRIWPLYYPCLDREPASCPSPAIDRQVSPGDHLQTFRWLYADSLGADGRAVLRYSLARLEDRAGERDSALAHYRALSEELERINPRIVAQLRRSVARLSR